MERLSNWDMLQACVSRVPRTAPSYSTNLFASRDQVRRWCSTTQLNAVVTDKAVLVLREERDFRRVYHVAEDMAALTGALAMLPPGMYTTDLVGKDNQLGQVCAAYEQAGFAHHAFLRRMNLDRTRPAFDGNIGVAELAGPGEAREILSFLERLLDRLAEQLPDEAEIAAAAADGRILVGRGESGLTGMLMYDLHGQLAHLRFWHVDADARGAGVGRWLMAGFLARCAHARRIMLWVIGDNDRSIAIYRHYGFETDGLLDRIMTLHKDHR